MSSVSLKSKPIRALFSDKGESTRAPLVDPTRALLADPTRALLADPTRSLLCESTHADATCELLPEPTRAFLSDNIRIITTLMLSFERRCNESFTRRIAMGRGKRSGGGICEEGGEFGKE